MIHSSSPGKLMLFGEHSVVYGNPCIATSVNKRLDVYVEENNEILIEGMNKISKFPSNENEHKFLNLTIEKIFEELEKKGKKPNKKFKIRTTQLEKGIGSSSAVVVSSLKALSHFYNLNLSNEEIFEIGFKIVNEIQGKASGYDIAVAVYGGTIFYQNFENKYRIEKLKNLKNLLAIYTGKYSDTTELIKEIHEKFLKYPEIIKGIFEITNEIVKNAKEAIENEDYEVIGNLMNINHGILNSLNLSDEEIENLINETKKFCYGAKISGAGRGDYIIALCKDKENLKNLSEILNKKGIKNF
ncbi:MAG: mevalonate kinase [Candidatus Altarchaeaceae archaeon]